MGEPGAQTPWGGILGQERARALLESHLEESGGAGSTLLYGPEGVGRFRLALGAARTVLGTTKSAAARVDSRAHPDLHLLLPADGIDGVRDTLHRLGRKPAEGPRPVLIARDTDRLSPAAFNALLKTLEEPPADAAIFLVSEGPAFLPETVVSRCRLVRLEALCPCDVREVLVRSGVAAGEADRGARFAGGSPGRALYRIRNEIPPAADALLERMQGGRRDPLEGLESLVRKRGEESSLEQRRRLVETLRLCAERLRGGLPETEPALRSVVEGLRSLNHNGSVSIVFSHVLLRSWMQRSSPPAP
ncbi:MAG: hypothetical protein ACE5JG_06605 [Planctomycetota bacterium]